MTMNLLLLLLLLLYIIIIIIAKQSKTIIVDRFMKTDNKFSSNAK